MKNHFQISSGLYLNSIAVNPSASTRKTVPTNINHIAVVDCSGSMYGELDKLRAGLKAKLPTLLREGDTLSLIWFSGRGQFGPILEAESVATLRDLAKISSAIDRWLRPQGLTGFKEPLVEATKMIERIQKLNGNPFALFFMSDGMDNQWSRQEILKTIEDAATKLVSSTFVEYGNYADRQMLATMAERAGGQLVHCDAFAKFEPVFAEAVTKTINGGKRIAVDMPGGTNFCGIAFELSATGELITYDATLGQALVGADTERLWFLSDRPHGTTVPMDDNLGAGVYAALSLFAVRMKPEIVFPLLKATGDVRFIKLFANCFGKQAYSKFMDAAKAAAFDSKLRLVDGCDPNLVPAEDAFTVLDLLDMLSNDEGARLLLDDPSFEYSKISRGQLDADENLTVAEQAQVATINAAIAKERNAKKITELQAQIATIMASKRDGLKFVPDVETDGYEISSLTFNQESPNISVLIRKTGTVDLTARHPITATMAIPRNFKSHIFRNYAIVAHGIVNVKTLPVDISKAVYRKLVANGVTLTDNERGVTCIDLTTLPIINRKMVKGVALKDAATIAWRLQYARAFQKVYKDYVKTKYPSEKLAGYSEKFGEDGAQWLKDNGLTEHNGFSPPRTQAEATDFIMGRELEFKIKGYSTLPPVAKVVEKVKAKGKLNGPEALMAEAILEVETFLKSPEKLHHAWLIGKEKSNQAEVRALAYQLSQVVFSIVVGQTWFKDCPTPDDKTVTLKVKDFDVIVTAELREVEIKL